MPVRNPTQWTPPSGAGSVAASSGAAITTLGGAILTTLALVSITLDSEVYTPKFATAWTLTPKTSTSWEQGTAVTVGNEFITDNLGNFLITNDSKNIVTTPTYTTNKNATAWTASGA